MNLHECLQIAYQTIFEVNLDDSIRDEYIAHHTKNVASHGDDAVVRKLHRRVFGSDNSRHIIGKFTTAEGGIPTESIDDVVKSSELPIKINHFVEESKIALPADIKVNSQIQDLRKLKAHLLRAVPDRKDYIIQLFKPIDKAITTHMKFASSGTYSVVISNMPVDIITMSHDKEWESCKTLIGKDGVPGMNVGYLKDEVGILGVAYLVTNDVVYDREDLNKATVDNAVARMLIYPTTDEKFTYFDKIYNNSKLAPEVYTKFKDAVSSWLIEKDAFISPKNAYHIPYEIYDDSVKSSDNILRYNAKDNSEEFSKAANVLDNYGNFLITLAKAQNISDVNRHPLFPEGFWAALPHSTFNYKLLLAALKCYSDPSKLVYAGKMILPYYIGYGFAKAITDNALTDDNISIIIDLVIKYSLLHNKKLLQVAIEACASENSYILKNIFSSVYRMNGLERDKFIYTLKETIEALNTSDKIDYKSLLHNVIRFASIVDKQHSDKKLNSVIKFAEGELGK